MWAPGITVMLSARQARARAREAQLHARIARLHASDYFARSKLRHDMGLRRRSSTASLARSNQLIELSRRDG
jgi:hypothetical protein